MQDQERERAEVFDALGHPTRISILKLLSQEALGFADLKKKTGIESSGHLQHHLSKLDGLIRTDEHGNYRLSDVGNDALFTVQTVEATSRRGRRKLTSDGRKSRILWSTSVATLTMILLVSTLYLSNAYISLNRTAIQTLNTAQKVNLTQYAVQNQYVCDVMTGSLQESGSLRMAYVPRPLAPQEWFNYTAVVISESNYSGIGYQLSDSATVPVFSSPVSNDTYYSQGFLEYELQVFGPNLSDFYQAHIYPVIGPDGWNGQVVSPLPSNELPPYATVQTSSISTPALFSGGGSYPLGLTVPISTFGNYTFCLRNEGNTVMQISWTITTPVVTLEMKPLTEESYPAWSPNFAQERIVRIRQQSRSNQSSPTPTAAIPDTTQTVFNTAALEISCAMILSAVSISAINHKKTWQARSDRVRS
jgi:DNA-binding transcriptional ArsR family regulator